MLDKTRKDEITVSYYLWQEQRKKDDHVEITYHGMPAFETQGSQMRYMDCYPDLLVQKLNQRYLHFYIENECYSIAENSAGRMETTSFDCCFKNNQRLSVSFTIATNERIINFSYRTWSDVDQKLEKPYVAIAQSLFVFLHNYFSEYGVSRLDLLTNEWTYAIPENFELPK